MKLDHNLLERLAQKAWHDSDHPNKADTWESAKRNHWRAKVASVCALAEVAPVGRALVSAIWGGK